MEHLDESTQEIIDDSSKIDEEIIDEQENKSANENLKYSQRNDGIIDVNSLKHEENSEYRVKDGKNVKILMKTKNNDVYSVEVIYKNGKKMMRGIGNYGGNETFLAEVPDTIKDYYFVGTYSYDKDHKHRVSDASVFDPVIAYYYPDFLDSDAAVQYSSGAPFDLERIEKKSKREIYAGSRMSEPIDAVRHRKIRDADAVFSSPDIDFIKMPEVPSKRITPSSLEKLYDAEAGRTTEAGFGESAGGDLYPEIDELLEKLAKENVRFGFDEFGTLVHAVLWLTHEYLCL